MTRRDIKLNVAMSAMLKAKELWANRHLQSESYKFNSYEEVADKMCEYLSLALEEIEAIESNESNPIS